jgi:hypothetical protein
MMSHAQPADPDALRRALAAVRRAIVAAARATARLAAATARWLRGEPPEGEKHLTRAERKRLRKEKLREIQSSKKSH